MARGILSERITDSTATGSGGDTIAPRTIAAAHVNDGCRARAKAATAAVETITITTDSRMIGPSWRRNSRSGKAIAPE